MADPKRRETKCYTMLLLVENYVYLSELAYQNGTSMAAEINRLVREDRKHKQSHSSSTALIDSKSRIQ